MSLKPEMKITDIDSCLLDSGSSNLRGTIFLQAIIGIKSYNQTSVIASSRKIIFLPMS